MCGTIDFEILKDQYRILSDCFHKLEETVIGLERKLDNLAEQCQNDYDQWGEPNQDKIDRFEKKLSRCPACGNEASIWSDEDEIGNRFFFIACKDEDDCGYRRKHFSSLDEAVDDWNTFANKRRDKEQ